MLYPLSYAGIFYRELSPILPYAAGVVNGYGAGRTKLKARMKKAGDSACIKRAKRTTGGTFPSPPGREGTPDLYWLGRAISRCLSGYFLL